MKTKTTTLFLLSSIALLTSTLTSQANSLLIKNNTSYPISVKNIEYLKGNTGSVIQRLWYEFNPRSTASSNLAEALKDGDITIDKLDAPFNPVNPRKDASQNWDERTVIGYQQYNKISYTIVRSGVQKTLEFRLQPQAYTEWRPFIEEDKASNAKTTPVIKIKTDTQYIYSRDQFERNFMTIYTSYRNYTVTFDEAPLTLKTQITSVKPVAETTGTRNLSPPQDVLDNEIQYDPNTWILKNDTGKNLSITVNNFFNTTLSAGEKMRKVEKSVPSFDLAFNIKLDDQTINFPNNKINKRHRQTVWDVRSDPVRLPGDNTDKFFHIEFKPQYYWKKSGLAKEKWFVDYEVRVYPE